MARSHTQAAEAPLLRLLRPHQWAKNILVGVPLISSGEWNSLDSWIATAMAFAALCSAASAGYVVNDLLDAAEDARHPTKCRRPIASGLVGKPTAIATAALLAVAAILIALSVDLAVFAWVCAYLGSTFFYSNFLKQYFLADTMFLAGLYTLRIIAGCAAIDVSPSIWLLSLSMFAFFSLALAKRYQEIARASDQSGRLFSRRDYGQVDRDIVRTLGVSASGLAALVVALYVEGDAAHRVYKSPEWLWLACPVIWYWLTRVWFKCERGELHDDPVVFAAGDRGSWMCFAVLFLCWITAALGAPSWTG